MVKIGSKVASTTVTKPSTRATGVVKPEQESIAENLAPFVVSGHVPSTDTLRVVVYMLTGITLRGTARGCKEAIRAWCETGEIPKARKRGRS